MGSDRGGFCNAAGVCENRPPIAPKKPEAVFTYRGDKHKDNLEDGLDQNARELIALYKHELEKLHETMEVVMCNCYFSFKGYDVNVIAGV